MSVYFHLMSRIAVGSNALDRRSAKRGAIKDIGAKRNRRDKLTSVARVSASERSAYRYFSAGARFLRSAAKALLADIYFTVIGKSISTGSLYSSHTIDTFASNFPGEIGIIT
jgi:hypothetical protein